MNCCSILSPVKGSESDRGLQQCFSRPPHMHTTCVCVCGGGVTSSRISKFMKAASVCTNQQWNQLACSCLTHKEEQQTMNRLEFGTGSPSCLPKSLALPLLWHSPVIPYSNRTTQQLMSQPLARQHPNLNTCLASVPAAKWSLRSMALIWRFSLMDKNKQEPPLHKTALWIQWGLWLLAPLYNVWVTVLTTCLLFNL